MGKKKKENKKEVIIDGVNTIDLTREQLEVMALKLKEELDREREQRSYFQVERDKISTFWEVSRNQVEELQSLLRNTEREREEENEKMQEMNNLNTQKCKFLQYEQTEDINALRAENLTALRNAQIEHSKQEAQLHQDKRDLRLKLSEQELAAQEELRKVKQADAEILQTTRENFEQTVKELKESAEFRLQTALAKLETARRTDLAEVEERKNKQLEEIIRSHEKAFEDLKSYYNDISLNNLGLLTGLRKQMESLQVAKERAETAMKDAIAAKRKLADPLASALAELTDVRRRACNADRDRASLAGKTLQLAELEKRHEKLTWDFEILKQRYDKVSAEKNELEKQLEKAVLERQHRASIKDLLVNKCSLKCQFSK